MAACATSCSQFAPEGASAAAPTAAPAERVTAGLARAGLRVVRGPDWKWDNQVLPSATGDALLVQLLPQLSFGSLPMQDGGPGSVGTMVTASSAGWWRVKWDANGSSDAYRTGDEGCYDLKVIGCSMCLLCALACQSQCTHL